MSLEIAIQENTQALRELISLMSVTAERGVAASNSRSDRQETSPPVAEKAAAKTPPVDVTVETAPASSSEISDSAQEPVDVKKLAGQLLTQISNPKGPGKDVAYKILNDLGYKTFKDITDFDAVVAACQKVLG
jgi:hypothetical protein